MSDVDEEEFMCGDDEEYDLVNCIFMFAYIYVRRLCCVMRSSVALSILEI